MKKFVYTASSCTVFALACTLAALLSTPAALAQTVPDDRGDLVGDLPRDRRAQTGMNFLSVSLDPQAVALGDAVTAWEGGGAHSMFYNPASMALMEPSFHVVFGHMQWIADMGYNYAGVAVQPFGGAYGVLGVSVLMVDYGEVQGTIRANNEQGYIDTYTFSPSAWAFGVSYARAITEQFSVGGDVRYVSQSLGTGVMGRDEGGLERKDFAAGTLAFDFGVLFRTGFRGINFGVSVRNLAPEVSYVEENFELPLTFRIGTVIDMNELARLDTEVHSFQLAVDAERPRSYDEQLRVGLEYLFLNTLALRAGYVYPTDEQGINLGAGIRSELAGAQFSFDYAYTRFGVFGNVHRLGLKLGF